MKSSKIPTLIFFLILASIVLTVILDVRKKNRLPIQRVFPETVDVSTNIDLPHINLITKTIIHEVLKMDTLSVMVLKMTQDIKLRDDITTLAFVIDVPHEEHSYIISISPSVTTRTQLIRVLAHEFAHIKQFETGQLQVVDRSKGLYIWEGDTMDLRYTDYKSRPMEIEAFTEGRRIEFATIPVLYGE